MSEGLEVVFAGSLEGLVQKLFRQFTRLTGHGCHGRSGGSRAWAQKLRAGEAQADVFLSADAQVNEIELMGEEQGNLVDWYVSFAANEMVIAHNRLSPALNTVTQALSSRNPLLNVLRSGLRLCRTDPEADPKGYRAIQSIELLSRLLRVPKLVKQSLGEPRNPEQLISPENMMPALARGDYDLALTYRSQAVEADLPFIDLPGCVNLGAPTYIKDYATVEYRCADGAVYPGALISYTAAILTNSPRPVAAAAFLTFLTTASAGRLYKKHGFRRIPPMLKGRLDN